MAWTIGPIVALLRADNAQFEKALRGGIADLQKFADKTVDIGKSISDVGAKMATRVTAPVVGAGTLATKTFMDFEKSMRQVNTIAKETESQFQSTFNQVLQMGIELKKSPTELADVLHEIGESGFIGANGLKVLRASTALAKADLGSISETASTLTQVLSAYNMETSKAADISDILSATVDSGVNLSLNKLNQSMGSLPATAATLKIPFENTMAAIAAMTKGGVSADEAFTSLNRVLMAFATGNKKLEESFFALTGQMPVAYLQANGLSKTMQVLQEATNGDAEAIANLGFEFRTFKAIAALTKNEGANFSAAMAAIADQSARAGAVQSALNEKGKALASQWEKMRIELQVLQIELGQMLVPAVRKMITAVQDAIKWWKSLDDQKKQNIITFAAVLAAIGPLLYIVGSLTSAFGSLFSMLVKFSTAQILTIPITFTSMGTAASAAAPGITALAVSLGRLAIAAAAVWGVYKVTELVGAIRESSKASKAAAQSITDVVDNELMAEQKFGKSIFQIKKERAVFVDIQTKAEADFNRILAQQIPLQEKINQLQSVAGREGVAGWQAGKDMQAKIDKMKAEMEAIATPIAKRPYFITEKDKEAKAAYEKDLEASVLDRLSIEEKINRLVQKRVSLQDEMARVQKDSAKYFEVKSEALKVEESLGSTLKEKADLIRENAKKQMEAPQFAAAVEAGTVEDYRVRIRADKRNQQEKIQKDMDNRLKELVNLFKQTNKILTEGGAEAEEVIAIL